MWFGQFYVWKVLLNNFKLRQKIKLKYFTVPSEKSKNFSFPSSIIKNIAAWFSRFPVKLICSIAFGSASSACCLLKSIATNL